MFGLSLIETTQPLDGPHRNMVADAMLMWLEPFHIRQGGYLTTLELYNGQLNAGQTADDIIEALAGLAPAMFVAPESAVYELGQSGRGVRYPKTNEIQVLVVSTAVRDRVTQLRGDELSAQSNAYDPGVHRMLDDIEKRIPNRKSGITGGQTFVPLGEDPLFTSTEMTVWRARFKLITEIHAQMDAELEDHPAAESVEARHNLVDDTDPVPEGVNPVVTHLTEA